MSCILAAVLLAGCSGAEETAREPSEAERTEATVEETTAEMTDGATTGQTEAAAGDAVTTGATQAEAGAYDDGGGQQYGGAPGLSPGDQASLDLGTCQSEEALRDLGPEGLQQLTDEVTNEIIAGEHTSLQEAFAARGYTCGGRANEVLGQ